MKNFYYKFIKIIKRILIKYSNNPRPSSYPLISGDTLRKTSDHIKDEEFSFETKDVKERDIIFVRTDMLHDFFKIIHPKIKSKYILISHNSDGAIDNDYIRYIDQKIIHWFAQNLIVKHPKITPFPIGLENIHWCDHGDLKHIRNGLKGNVTKKARILSGFNIRTNEKERTEADKILQKNPLTDKIVSRLSTKDYFDKLKEYKFVVSPPGNGEDCIRTWEALYFRTVPIVKRSVLTEYFKENNLPLLLVDSWEEVINFDTEFLNNFYENNKKNFNSKMLMMDYWIKQINDYKK